MGEFIKTEIAGKRLAKERRLERANAFVRAVSPIIPDSLKDRYPFLDGRDRYQGRPLIGRDTPINGGVYVGAGSREAIVVDMTKSPILSGILEQVKTRTFDWDLYQQQSIAQYDKSRILSEVFTGVRTAIRETNPSEVDSYILANKWDNDVKTNLDNFYRDGFGVCRHFALGAGVIIESLIDQGILKGRVSVDRSSGSIGDRYGGHAWVRYQSQSGKIFILDPMLNYAGELTDAMHARSLGERIWEYARPSDYEA